MSKDSKLNKEIKDKTADIVTEILELFKSNDVQFQPEIFDSVIEIVEKHDLELEEFIDRLDDYPHFKSVMAKTLATQGYDRGLYTITDSDDLF